MIRLINTFVMKNPFISNKKRAYLIKNKLGNIGSNCEIFKNVDFGSEPYLIDIGDNVRLTYGVRFITHDGGIYVLRNLNRATNKSIYGKIKIGNNVFVGNEVMILPGVEIGDNVIIGARSVVTKSIPSNSIVGGCPAKVLGDIFTYNKKYESKYVDTSNMNKEQKEVFLKNINDEKLLVK